MRYHDGTEVTLGDIVRIPVPSGTARMKVVLLGDTRQHLEIDQSFLDWITRQPELVSTDTVILEFVDENPFLHNDPGVAPVGNLMFSRLDEHVARDV